LSELILKDFSTTNKCGEECRYDDSYLLIEQEIDKIHSVTQEETNWLFVYENSQEFLETKTKDLKLMVWWLFSHFKNNSWQNFEKKLDIFITFLNNFGEELYPKSIKGKKSVIYWFEENLSNEILNFEQNKKNINKAVELYEQFLDLNNSINFLLQDEERRFKKIIDLLKPFFDEAQKKSEEKEAVIENSIEPEISGDITSDSDAIKLLNNTKKNLSSLALYYRQKDYKDLKALRITRFLSWLETEGLPFADGNTTSLYPPAELEVDELNSLLQEEKYEEALNLAEEILEVSPFWISGHFIVFEIFEKTNNQNISQEIKNQLISFIKTNEGILDFYFNDKTPFASSRVKKWLSENMSENSELKQEVSETNKQKEEVKDLIDTLAQSGKLKEAMFKIEKQYDDSSSIEDKFNWRLYHAQLAVKFNKKDIAFALLDDLQKTIDKFNLDEWNPKLASKVYTLILNTFSNIDIENEKLEQIYKRLCITDINSAFEIKLN